MDGGWIEMARKQKAGAGGKLNTTRRNLVLALAVLSAGITTGLVFYMSDPSQKPVYADAGDAALVALGGTIYEANCASCHGGNLEGQPNWRYRQADGRLPAPPHDETGHTWHHPDQQLFDVIKFGGPAGMPGFSESLTDRQIVAALAYIKSRWPVTIRRRQDIITRPNR